MVKNRMRALLSQHAVVLLDVTDLYGKAGLAWLLLFRQFSAGSHKRNPASLNHRAIGEADLLS